MQLQKPLSNAGLAQLRSSVNFNNLNETSTRLINLNENNVGNSSRHYIPTKRGEVKNKSSVKDAKQGFGLRSAIKAEFFTKKID